VEWLLAVSIARDALTPARVANYHVYILTSDGGTLYIGITSDLQGRIFKHRMNHEDD
jgi:predicted GIY-YIG superfamily endonuclease